MTYCQNCESQSHCGVQKISRKNSVNEKKEMAMIVCNYCSCELCNYGNDKRESWPGPGV